MTNVVLASTSQFREALLRRILPNFMTCAPNTDESAKINETAPQLAQRLAIEKAASLQKIYAKHIIIGSDQVATFDDSQIIGKPHNHQNAVAQLMQSSNKTVRFYTGVSILNTVTGYSIDWTERFDVQFRTLSQQLIENYLRKEQPYQCAGSFKSEGLGVILFDKMQGDDPTSLIGLPLIKTAQALEEFGVNFFAEAEPRSE